MSFYINYILGLLGCIFSVVQVYAGGGQSLSRQDYEEQVTVPLAHYKLPDRHLFPKWAQEGPKGVSALKKIFYDYDKSACQYLPVKAVRAFAAYALQGKVDADLEVKLSEVIRDFEEAFYVYYP